jgi:Flp pilus assembly protein TadG
MKPVSNQSETKDRCRLQKGVAAVELAIILPLLVILLLGILEVGGMTRDHQVLQNAAREGARFSALASNNMGDSTNPAAVENLIKSRIIAYLANENITVSNGAIVVNQTYPLSVGGLTITGSEITITYTRPLLTPGVTSLIPLGSRQLRGTAVFRNFYD